VESRSSCATRFDEPPELGQSFVEKSYYLGPDKGGHKAYRLLGEAMQETGRVALGHYVARGKSHLVVIRPYREGLMMHQVFYSNEVRDFGDIDLGDDVSFKPAEEKIAGQEITTAAEAPRAKVIDLFEALKASVEQSQATEKRKLKPPKKAAAKKTRKKKAASSKDK